MQTPNRLRISRLVAGALGVLAAMVSPKSADGAIVERVVAVVGERPILLSELRQRAAPHLLQIAMSNPNPSQQAARESEAFRFVLNTMIDQRLEEQAADKAHITVTPEEVDNGIRQVAARAHLDPKQLVAEAKRAGLTEQDYRDEIRRQILEGKLIQLRVRGRVRVTEQDARATYVRYAKQVADESQVDLRMLVLQIIPGSSQQVAAARVTFAEELSRKARAGEDFCELVRTYSDDSSTKNTCGSRGSVPLNVLLPQIQEVATKAKPNEVSDPIVFQDPNGQQAVIVVKTVNPPGKAGPYEQLKEQMLDLAFEEATRRQTKLWLQELRRGLYIDVRL